jgi:uncharacterized protein (TIGR02452 family)
MMTKEERIEIFKNTVRLVKAKGYSLRDTTVTFDDMENMKNNTKFYSKKVNIEHNLLPKYDTKVSVMDNDCLDAAQSLVNLGLKPAVLNMASFHTPGGGVERGSAAQEESIFRRTNIFMSLYQFHEVGTNYKIEQREERYPLEMHYGGIYTPNVTVFRKSENENCRVMSDPFKIDVITLPAVRKPSIDENGDVADWVKDILTNKIKQILDIALENGNDSLVLSAFGCGAYGTPPKIVAKLFYDIIYSDEYKNLFKEIVFAIINLPSTNGAHNPDGNFKPFKDIFE